MYKFSSAGGNFLPVSVDFIKNYMPSAPGDYIKVYLFGLLQASAGSELSVQSICRSLNLTEIQIEEALQYWNNKGMVLLTGNNPTQCVFLCAQTEEAPPNPKLYGNQSYIAEIQSILDRNLSTNEVKTFLDFTDVYGLPREIVIRLVGHCSSEAVRGRNVSVSYLEKMALNWADEGIDTLEKAETKISCYNAITSGALRVLRRLDASSGRLPTADEQDLYEKWTKEWGFTQDAILLAMSDTTASLKPSMKYLDAILKSYYEKGIQSSTDLDAYKRSQLNLNELLMSVLEALKYTRKRITPELENMYASWTEMGFSHECILLACEQTEKMGNRSVKKADLLLNEWQQAGITQKADILKYVRSQNKVDKKIEQVFECAGINKAVSDIDRKNYLKWTQEQMLSHDVLLFAAEISSITQNPLAYMTRILQNWASSGINTLEKAQKQNLSILSGKKAAGDYEQRVYSKDHFEKDRVDSDNILEGFYE
jgi:DnaD/phage-associated family protein